MSNTKIDQVLAWARRVAAGGERAGARTDRARYYVAVPLQMSEVRAAFEGREARGL